MTSSAIFGFVAIFVAAIAVVMSKSLGANRKNDLPNAKAPVRHPLSTKRERGVFYGLNVVGEASYQTALLAIAGPKQRRGAEMKVDAILLLDDDNAYDDRAVRVTIQSRTVGYLSRQTARTFRKRIADAGIEDVAFTVPAIIVGGWRNPDDPDDEGHYGVKLARPKLKRIEKQ